MKDFKLTPSYFRKNRKRVGRGHGSGNGKTSGKGHKGQKSRSGTSTRWGFEGGQMPLQRRIPKRGFKNMFAKRVVAINVEKLQVFNDGDLVNINKLVKSGIIKCNFDKVKIIGFGDFTKMLTIEANMFSKNARSRIEGLGGMAKVV
ncbi:MAG: 50S ribosomal protein L15 [Firmicutes bacterium]|nr:50S ribosomal protein L15 [Bacillota bacterium]